MNAAKKKELQIAASKIRRGIIDGVHSAKAALKLAEKYYVRMPIIEQVNAVLFDEKPATEAVRELMVRDGKTENPLLPWER